MENLYKKLITLGLSEKESWVYLSSLELGPASVQDICHKARVNRATTYVIIESLSSRGLMSTFEKGKKRFFAAESPERLLSVIKLQKTELEEKEKAFEELLPSFMALFNVEGEKPQIRYLEGKEGLHTVRELFLKLDGEILQIVPFDHVRQYKDVTDSQHDHLNQMSQSGSFRALLVMDEENIDQIPFVEGGEVRIIPKDEFPVNAEITVREDTVCLYSFKSNILSVVIKCPEIADAVRALFNLAWKGTEDYKKKQMYS